MSASSDNLSRRAEILAVVVVALVALAFRVIDLTQLPDGLHGDEAITGMEGWRVQAEGNIGVYTGSALGQPTLMYYPLAVVQWIFGDGIATLRGFAALGGVASIALTWWVARTRLGPVTAIAAAATLAVMVWSVHYSRIAFNLAWWPLVGLAAVHLLDSAIETNARWRWVGAGVFASLGVYVYNAHWIFGGAVALFVGGWAVANRSEWRRWGAGLALFALAGAVALAPMGWHIATSEAWGNHADHVSIQSTPEWVAADGPGKFGLVLAGYARAWLAIVTRPAVDLVDGAGLVAPLGVVTVGLLVFGVVVAVREQRSWFMTLLFTLLVVMPFAPAFTQDSTGELRRDFVLAPVIAILVGVALDKSAELVDRRFGPERSAIGRRYPSVAPAAVVTVPLVVMAAVSFQSYFRTFRAAPLQRWVFVAELTEPAAAMRDYGSETFVNFYSPRHSIRYETLQYLAPNADGVDRSREFGETQQGFETLDGVEGPQLFVLIGSYAQDFAALRAVQNGEIVASGLSGDVEYVAYLVPARNR